MNAKLTLAPRSAANCTTRTYLVFVRREIDRTRINRRTGAAWKSRYCRVYIAGNGRNVAQAHISGKDVDDTARRMAETYFGPRCARRVEAITDPVEREAALQTAWHNTAMRTEPDQWAVYRFAAL